jgi:hypothetical protein
LKHFFRIQKAARRALMPEYRTPNNRTSKPSPRFTPPIPLCIFRIPSSAPHFRPARKSDACNRHKKSTREIRVTRTGAQKSEKTARVMTIRVVHAVGAAGCDGAPLPVIEVCAAPPGCTARSAALLPVIEASALRSAFKMGRVG